MPQIVPVRDNLQSLKNQSEGSYGAPELCRPSFDLIRCGQDDSSIGAWLCITAFKRPDVPDLIFRSHSPRGTPKTGQLE